MKTIDDLLNALQNPCSGKILSNTKDTWSKIGTKDSFDELAMGKDELPVFLQEWMKDNPYKNI